MINRLLDLGVKQKQSRIDFDEYHWKHARGDLGGGVYLDEV